ncbi:hypothetical protein AMK59_8008 [Oryctes borbonicus]|uniref:Uncharacterized protein n=1 Tax=Oryctes borbonicus TaxID=1629725 RepID=A0A0T6AX64_9SCAR|nr:hypothetical protein AMK59_8008 [Oryctes borbonicus]
MEEESQSSPKSPDSPDTQTIVITPSELQKMGFAKELESVIEAQTHKTETEIIAPAKPVDDKQVVTIDPKIMKSKLCTLLNHTPLVMQVKDINWLPSERKSPILLNSISKIPAMVQSAVCLSPSPTNAPIVIDDLPLNETKAKLKIVSDEKLNISASEIENMLNRGKLLKSDEKISSPLQKLNAEEKLDLETEKDKNVPKEPFTKCIISSTRPSISASSANISEVVSAAAPVTFSKKSTVFSMRSCNLLPTTSSTVTSAASSTIISAAPSTVTSAVSINGSSKAASTDDKILKKECLKRIQAKLYENLKKVMEEVESRPIKDRASFSIKAVTSTIEEVPTRKSAATAKPVLEKCKENKPCYMNKYRERKLSQEACETRTCNDDVIEIDSKPSSPANVIKGPTINIVDGTDTDTMSIEPEQLVKEDTRQNELVKIYPRKVGRPRKQSNLQNEKNNLEGLELPGKGTLQNELDENDAKKDKQQPQAGGPLKKCIAKRFSESVKQSNILSNDNPPTSQEQKIPRKRGRPRKNDVKKIDNEAIEVEANLKTGTETERKRDSPLSNELKEIQESTTYADPPTRRRRGRPPKKRPAESTENERQAFSNIKKEEIVGDIKESSSTVDLQTECKIAKKRGRKSKAELEAMRRESEQRLSGTYTPSKTSGRKRKVIDYSILNGDDSEDDEPEIKVKKEDLDTKKTSQCYTYTRRSDKTNKDEYGSSPRNDKGTVKIDIDDDGVTSSEKEINSDDLKDDTVQYKMTTEEIVNEEQENEKTDVNPNAAQVKCAICKSSVDEELWFEHKRKIHNDLAWNSSEEPLNLDDTTVVEEILNSVLKEEGILKCSLCENKSDTAEHFVQHKKNCSINLNLSVSPGTSQRKYKKRKPGGSADVVDSLISNFTFNKSVELEENSENDNVKPTNLVELKNDQVQCAVCMIVMSKMKWFLHKQNMHNNLAWRTSDQPLDLNDPTLVMKILKDLCVKRKCLRCDVCGMNRKSVVGFISHRSQCEKSVDEIDVLRVKCHLCDRRMLPISLPRHIVLSHQSESPETIMLNDHNNEVVASSSKGPSASGKRKAAYK